MLGKLHCTIFFIFNLGAYNFINRTLSRECNCKHVGESYPLQVPDDIHSPWKICKNIDPFFRKAASVKESVTHWWESDKSFCLVVVRDTGLWTNIFIPYSYCCSQSTAGRISVSCCSSVAWRQSQDDLVKDRVLFIPLTKILSWLAIGLEVIVTGEVLSRWPFEGIMI